MQPNDTISQLEHTLSPGWAINVYNCDRRLVFALTPSHGWAMLAGAIVGWAIALMSFDLPSSDSGPSPALENITITAPLQLD